MPHPFAPANHGPSSAGGASHPHDGRKTTMLNLTSLQSIIQLAMAGYGVAKDLAGAAPQLANDAKELKNDGDAIGAALKKAYADVTGGHIKDTPDDIAKVLSAFGKGVQHVQADIPHVAGLAASASSLPSASGIANVLKAIKL